MVEKLKILVMLALLTAGLSVPAGLTALQKVDLAEAQRSYEQTLSQRQRLVERLQTLEDRYQDLVRRIEKLKNSGAMSTIAGRLELQDLLSSSKSISDELDDLQQRVRALDNRLAGQRSTLVSGLDQRVSDLEASLAGSSTSKRKAIVSRLNALRRRRSNFTTPLPAVPSTTEVNSALELAEEAAHPDELMAAADELQDTEDQLRKRLEAIDRKLQNLKKSRALIRRARSFSREEKFFEETDRDRVIARYERETRTARDDNGQTTKGPEAPPEAESEPTAGDGAGDFNGNNAAGIEDVNEGIAAAPNTDADANFTGGGEQRSARDAEITDSPSGAPVADTAPSDPFETSRETIVIDDGGDPSRAVGEIGSESTGLKGQIRRLENEQRELEEQADELSKRARELRRKAEQM